MFDRKLQEKSNKTNFFPQNWILKILLNNVLQ